jgi:hypothetical protein
VSHSLFDSTELDTVSVRGVMMSEIRFDWTQIGVSAAFLPEVVINLDCYMWRYLLDGTS